MSTVVASDAPNLVLTLTPQPDTDAVAELILTFENGDSVALTDATKSDIAADTVNGVPAYSIFTWNDEGISFKSGVPVLFNFYGDDGNSLIDSLTDVVVDGTTWTDDRSDRIYGVQARDAEGRTSARVRYVCSERTGCVIPGVTASGGLVKNTGQTSVTLNQLNSADTKAAQQFTTGSHADGYTLSSIGFDFLTIQSPSTARAHLTATLNEVASNGNPGNVLCTLSDPSSFTNAVNTFDAPATCPTLAANTTYFVVIERVLFSADVISLLITNSTNEDTGSAVGWTIGDAGRFLQSGAWQSTAIYMIEVISDPN